MLSQNELSAVSSHVAILSDLYHHINEVRKQPIHPGQATFAKNFFIGKKRILQGQWGRNGGKTEAILYIAWVYALLNPGTEIYIICPEKLQGKKIYWSSKRLQQYGPTKYILETRDSELRLVLNNNSQIVIDGCENYEGLRGVKPNLVIYDEFQHHSREFHVEVMEPNLMGKDCSLVVMGTPPKKKSAFYVEFRKEILEQIKSGDNTRFYMELPTEINPKINRLELAKIKQKLIKAGDEAIWMREYEAKLVFGGDDAVFPTWNEKRHLKPHSDIMRMIEKDSTRMKWFTICDPGSSTCFGVLFGVHNPFNSQIYLLGEIYEKNRKKTDTVSIWRKIQEMQQKLNPHAKWRVVYDEAAAWFRNEVYRHFQVNIQPTNKRKRAITDEADDISLAKSIMTAEDCLFVSKELQYFPWEVESYITNEEGKYPDRDDHLIQCFLYMLAATNFRFHEQADMLLLDRDGRPVSTMGKIQKLGSDADKWADMTVEDSYEQCQASFDA